MSEAVETRLAAVVQRMTPEWEIASWTAGGVGSHAIVSKHAESVLIEQPPPDTAEPSDDLRGAVMLRNLAPELCAVVRAARRLSGMYHLSALPKEEWGDAVLGLHEALLALDTAAGLEYRTSNRVAKRLRDAYRLGRVAGLREGAEDVRFNGYVATANLLDNKATRLERGEDDDGEGRCRG